MDDEQIDRLARDDVIDRGLTHVALLAGDLDASIAFYEKYAAMRVVHRRDDGRTRVAWISDGSRPFVIVLIEVARTVLQQMKRIAAGVLPQFAHLGVGCASREEVDALCDEARREGVLARTPTDSGPPVGYWALIRDPDGHMLEVSYGQEVGLAVEEASARQDD